MVRRMKSEVTFGDGQRFLEPVPHVVSTLGDATRQERDLTGPLDEYLVWLADEEARYDRAGARQKAKGCQFLASMYRKRFGSSVAALRATLRRRLGLPPAEEDSDLPVPYSDTDTADPEDELIDPGADAEAPPPPLSDRERALATALLDAAMRVPFGEDSKLRALSALLRRADLDDEKVVVFTEYRDTLRAAAWRLDRDGVTYTLFHGGTPDRDRHATRSGDSPTTPIPECSSRRMRRARASTCTELVATWCRSTCPGTRIATPSGPGASPATASCGPRTSGRSWPPTGEQVPGAPRRGRSRSWSRSWR